MHSRDKNYAGVPALRRAWTGGERRNDRHRDGARRGTFGRLGKLVAMLTAFLTLVLVGTPVLSAQAVLSNPGPVGSGFTVTPGDLSFILKQIKIGEHHSKEFLGGPGTTANPDPTNDPEYCSSLLGPGPDQIPDVLTSYGLRTVDGSCNNLKTGPGGTNPDVPGAPSKFGASDQPFPRLTTPVFSAAEPITPAFPVGPPGPTSYAQKLAGNVVIDSQPRVISNLIVDQTATNPAAVAAAEFPVRTQGNPGKFPCTVDPDPTALPTPILGVPAGCVPSHQTLFIPNVTTDVGLSPPYNSLFTFFGQFFDHGVDQTVKSGGTVFVPLRADDPLRTVGPDGIAGTGDEVPASQAFMVLTRAQNQPGPDGKLGTADDIQNANNTDTPWVDQSQTYTSHASHQVFLREYALNAANRPVSTGKLLGGIAVDDTLSAACTPTAPCYNDGNANPDSISTWASTKQQAAKKLGLLLTDKDVLNIPMIATDPYGKFTPGPARGLPQYVTATGLVEGNLAAPVPVPANVKYFDTPFLTDIAHNADPSPQDTDNNPATPPVVPVPDSDFTASADFINQPVGTYDDEMLNDHFTCGDGRCNENIALSTIHQVFHSEHDRLVDYIKGVLTADTSPAGLAALPEWKLPVAQSPDGWNGERLFQAARFVNEMEYQHLVFEEFARKVQPAVRPFHVYSPDINPAIDNEFAAAVYRFGHSMLDDDVARTNTSATGVQTDNSIPLLTAFLNPPEYFNGHAAGILTPEQAAGSVIMGSSDQVGNELDEFVTETLRNNLLGLPLDLPTINMTRARESGIPPLNNVRRQIFAKTNDGQLAPYTSWSDFGQHLKHPESLINFVAAYGTHPTIRDSGPDGDLGTNCDGAAPSPGCADNVTTIAKKRAAARAIVNPIAGDVPPADAADFMFSTGAWSSDANGVTNTGLDNVDLWVGGLAEVTNLNGGLLGSTFNYVFETQLEKLQDGDRLYYLARTPGMNLRTQLEGNSFSELIQRNTDNTNTLKADAFSTADCKFQLGNIKPYDGAPTSSSTATPPLAAITGVGAVDDDLTTPDCDENQLLLRKPDGTIQYRAINKIDPSGINGQAVYNGTSGADKVNGGNDNDTFWGGAGNDVIEGNGGDDIALGGEGNDIITDLSGADVEKGGPGNDAMDAGIGDDIMMGGDGADFLNGGANDNEEFAGPGNDFIIAGQGADAVFGDGGDDWIEGGTGQDLLQGDHGAPFFDDPAETAPGNDIFIGQPGENDYDAEGGDDVMAQNAAIDRNAGAAGFDWAFHQYDTVGADDDMEINNNLVGVPIQIVVNRDRWQETEADSGSAFNDVIKGTTVAPSTLGGAGFAGCDALDAAGVARISGLNQLVTTFPSPLAPIVALSAAGFCPLTGTNVWAEGDILLGGGGSDTITGRDANDIIDGDRFLSVKISVRTNPADPATEIGSTDLMEDKALSGNFGTGTAGMTLQQAVFAGLVDPGNLVAVREIKSDSSGTDTAVFRNARAAYTITRAADGTLTVNNITPGPKTDDGIDTLRNIERLQFTDTTISVATPGVPTITTLTPASGRVTVNWTPPAGTVVGAITGYDVRVVTAASVTAAVPAGVQVGVLRSTGGAATSVIVTGLTNGTAYRFQVRAKNNALPPELLGAYTALSASVTPAVAPTLPPVPAVAPVALGLGATLGAVGAPITVGITWAQVGTIGAVVNGSPLRGYIVTATPTAGAPVSTLVIPGAAGGLGNVFRTTQVTVPAGSYTLTVRSVTDFGQSAPSTSVGPIAAR
jgi:Ca2+-binding RTX toxin-like protein